MIHFPNVTKGVVTVQPHGIVTAVDVPLDFTAQAFDDGFVMSAPLTTRTRCKMHPNVTSEVNFGGGASGSTENRDGVREIYQFVCDTVLPRFPPSFPRLRNDCSARQ